MVTTISATRLDGRWQDKPDHDVVPRQAMLERGMRFMCMFDRTSPPDIVTGQLPSAIPTQNGNGGLILTPWGVGHHITAGNGPLQFPNHANYNITGPLTILTRAWIDSDGGDSFWNGIVKKRANGSSVQSNCPFSWGCYNYYNGGDRTIKFAFTRANGSGYRQFNGPSEEHIGTNASGGPVWKNFALINGGAIETAGTSIIDGVVGTLGGQGTAGSGTGAASTNSDVLHFGDDGVGSTKEVFDWMAIFAGQLSASEVEEIMAAPFGELVEPEIERDYHDLWIPRRVNAGVVTSDVSYSGRRRGVGGGVARGV